VTKNRLTQDVWGAPAPRLRLSEEDALAERRVLARCEHDARRIR